MKTVIALSKSGETPEIKVLIPLLKARKNKIIGLVGNTSSFLATQSDYILNSTVEKEACPNNLAPTTSTTAQLVIGDALAICLLELRGFSAKDFAHFHPGGALGKRMYMRVKDLSSKNEVPSVDINENIANVIIEISSKRLGATAVLDEHKVVGTATGAIIGGLLGNQVGEGQGKTLATVAGAVAGGYAGNKVQGNMQESNTYTTTERRCRTVTDSRTVVDGYDVSYRLGEEEGKVRMDHKPGDRIPVVDGQLVLSTQ